MLLAALALASTLPAQYINQVIKSPRISTEAVLGRKLLKIDYGSPSVRGREVMGKLVPYGKVWAIGANKAATFSTEVDIIFEGLQVPQGTYTLFSVPSEKSWEIIVNKRLDLWCKTPYGSEVQASEVGRVRVQTNKLSVPVEQLYISFVKSGNGVVLRIEWEKTRADVNISANTK